MYAYRYMLIMVLSLTAFSRTRAEDGLDRLIEEARQNNPQLRTARYTESAARTRIDQAGALDPPQVGIEFFMTPIESFPWPNKDGKEMDYSFQQNFPFPGKLSLKEKSTSSYASMTKWNTSALERLVIRDIKVAWYGLYLAERRLEINRGQQDLLREMIEFNSHRYEVGEGTQSDILRAQTELSLLAADTLELVRDGQITQARLNTLAGRAAGAPLPAPDSIDTEFPAWSVAQLDSLALISRPELRQISFAVDMNRFELDLARRELYPDFMVRLMFKDMQMSGHDYWSTMFGFSVPQAFWSRKKYSARIEENRIDVLRRQEELADMQNQVLFQVHSAFYRVQAGRDKVEYYRRNVLPQAGQTLQSTVAAYRAGTSDFLSVLDASRIQLRAREQYETSLTDYMAGQADLEQAVGLELSRIRDEIPSGGGVKP